MDISRAGLVRTRLIGIVLCTLGLMAPAYATAIFDEGNHPQKPFEENVLFHTGGVTGTTIDGSTNRTHTLVQFSSTNTTLFAKGGQSDIDAVSGGLIHDITMTLPGFDFLDAIINPFKEVGTDDLVVTVVTNTGTQTFTYGSPHGNNFLTITTTPGEVLESVTVDSASGFQSFMQPRISGVVPEPSSILLLGSGLLAFLLIQKRSRFFSFMT